jgi:glutamate---cysteine ligase / carboxylate-amine ligase
VEEEFLIIDPTTRRLRPQAEQVVPEAETELGDHVDPEFKLSQVETTTTPCESLEELRNELVELRRGVIQAAERADSVVGAAGTHPFSHKGGGKVTPKEPYIGLEREYQRLAREKVICGCHVHVGVSDREAAVQVMNRVRPWLSTVLALAVNSPFWLGEDTGYGSFRTEVWRRWPTAGTPHVFASSQEYDTFVNLLLETGGIDDPARLFWDVRPSPRFDTLEYRVTDVCLTVDDSLAVAALFRALTQTCHAEVVNDEPMCDPRPELLGLATWRAARHGLDEQLINVCEGKSVPAVDLLESFLSYLRPVLEENGEWKEVCALVEGIIERGPGATRQRKAFQRAERLEDVVDAVVKETKSGVV